MIIFPAIDLYGGKGVRLYKGDYTQMTVYSEDPVATAKEFVTQKATHIHLVDLEGAKQGTTPNLETVCRIKAESGLFCEIGGGIRTLETAERYISAGLDRVILGTAALKDEGFLREAVAEFGEKVAAGADIRDGFVSVSGWTENSSVSVYGFFERMAELGVKNIICTDISKDGAMQGTNLALYRDLSKRFPHDITASGGVSSLADVIALAEMGIYGAIIGKAWYTGAVDLRKAIEVAAV